MYCPTCGNQTAPGSAFCPNCGTPLTGGPSGQGPITNGGYDTNRRYDGGRNVGSGRYNGYNDYNGNNRMENASGYPGRPMRAPIYGTEPVKDDFSTWKYYLLGFITCFIYMLWIWYKMIETINIVCKGDGEETPGFLKFMLLTVVTFGIYGYVFSYKFAVRLQNNMPRYHQQVKSLGSMDLGPAILLLTIGGMCLNTIFSLIIGTSLRIGIFLSIYAYYLTFANINMLAQAYNHGVRARMSSHNMYRDPRSGYQNRS